MGSRFPSHQLSNGLYVSGRPEQPKERAPTMSSVAMPYTGGDIKKSGELGKMFDIPVDGSKSRKSGPITGAPSRTGSFGGAASHSGPIMPNAAARAAYTTSGAVSSGGAGSVSLKKSNSGPLNKHGEPVKKSSGPQSGGVTPSGRQNSGPIPPVLPTTGLITSGPISSGPLNSSGAPRKVSGPLESMGSMKNPASAVIHNQAVTVLSQDDDFSFRKNFPKLILWSLILLFVMGFIAGGFILGAVHNAILLIVVVVLFGAVASFFIWNTCFGTRAIMAYIARYPDAELRNAKNGQFVKISGVVTCGNVPLESSFQRVPRCVYTSTSLYEYRGWDSKAANPTHRRFSWGLRSLERRAVDFYISDFQSGLRALVKTGYGARVTPYVDDSLVIDANPGAEELSPDFLKWLGERNLSSDDRIMRMKEGYIKEGSTVSVMGVVQRNDNVLMIVPPPEPITTGCQWAKCIFPASLEDELLYDSSSSDYYLQSVWKTQLKLLICVEQSMLELSTREMARPSGKQKSTKLVIVCVVLLGFGLIGDYLWASSPHFASSSYISNRVPPNNPQSNVIIPKQEPHLADTKPLKIKVDGVHDRSLSATFADLPAPELKWEKMANAPVPRLDGAAIQIKDLLYVFAGYGTIDFVHSHVDIYNFTGNTWGGRFDMPKEMAHSHLGMVTDGRYIYVVTGQHGPQCRGPTARNFVLDTKTRKWQDLLPLPAPRYAPATQLWRGRLHVMGGSKENRHTPALEHWSIAVKDGKALEKEWRTEIQIPRGGPHRACVVVNDKLLIIGGQEGDFMAKPGSPIFKCSRRNEIVYDEVHMLDNEMKWKPLPPMLKPDSHIEFAWTIVNNSIVIAGGTTEKHPITKKMVLVGEVFQFNLDTLITEDFQKYAKSIFRAADTWSVIGKLPYRVKTTLVGFWNGWLYFTSGQRDRGPDDPAPKKTRLGMELDASLHMVHVFQLWCRLSAEPITVTVDYEWKLATYKTLKVFGHLCKTPVEASTVSMEDLLKIKLEGILFMLVSHYD
ncbi:hypothetical protein SADUNF_Sadunf08G0003400 [Salix dunnii]|uniref:Kelch repeat-containing protein n=1 Tax=Salix dunnii TaxID=1413687 RepID=A0A835JWR5_9ROSI|nr:hypothetical protein SADUNF_Sadunf08G0003400 [Salix dunnii]